ncbi:hypothetical protein [Chryseobacterium sp. POE27]|uniref:hypothetical protein n=1 Tax=Chryseobacterium sp. POE27 TaxID=3138177 RepID=UPI0032193848
MRKAFVGLSSPIGYNYGNNFEEKHNKPNPLLDSPMGLFLFYDEIWFANRRVCPLNCENLPYVKFLDEEYYLNNLGLEQFSWKNEEIAKKVNELYSRPINIWEKSMEMNIGPNNGYDNHGRGFKLGNLDVSLNPSALNLMIDDYISQKFNFDLITNSVTNSIATSQNLNKNYSKNRLTQILICENIPNFQLSDGPYHEIIDDLRSESLLKNFREKIDNISILKTETDFYKTKEELEKAMDVYLAELILKHLSNANIFKSTSSAVIGQVPILGNIYGVVEGGVEIYKNIKDRNEAGWIGFLANAKLKFK